MAQQEVFVPGWRGRAACSGDLGSMCALSHLCLGSDAWSLDSLREELAREWGIVEVAESSDGALVGYLIAWRVADEGSLLQIVTHPEWRRVGIATHLVDRLCDRLRSEGARVVFLEVRAANRAARSFYERRGFVAEGVRRAYYSDPVDDAVVMSLALPTDG